jgi:hypothetical protein
MKFVFCLLALAAGITLIGCSLFRDPNVRPAVVSSFLSPDTVRAGTTFDVTAHVGLGAVSGYVEDHREITRSRSALFLRVWSRDIGGPNPRNDCPTEEDITFQPKALVPGSYRLVAPSPYPDWPEIEKTVTVLP